MKKEAASQKRRILAGLITLLLPISAFAADTVISTQYRSMSFCVFLGIISFTLVVTYWAAKKSHSANAYYTANGGISGFQNGLAITGDYISAAAFLGVSGLVSLYGYDGILYVVGFFVAFIPVLLFIAEPCRNIGQYTLGDILAFRNDFRSSKIVAAISSVVVTISYLVPQIVGVGVLIKSLLGINYEVSVVVVGILMLAYVTFGGMLATTWVQIIKAVFLLFSCFLLVIVAWLPYGFDLSGFLGAIIADPSVQQQIGRLIGGSPGDSGLAIGLKFLEPGLYLKNPLEQVSLGLALVLGTAAMPHILMRFFTVPNAKAARSSVMWAMITIGICHLLIVMIGLSAAHYVGALKIMSFDKGGNLAAPLLAQYLGGGANSLAGNLFLAFVAAVAFASILAVVAGLTLAAASSMAHDVYVGAIKGGHATEREQFAAAKISTVVVGLVAISLGLLAKGQNVAHLVGLAFAIAASANLPSLVLTLYWKRCNTRGVVLGVLGGMFAAIAMVLVSPNMSYPVKIKADANLAITENQAKILNVEQQLAASSLAANADQLAQLAKANALIAGARQNIADLGDTGTSIVGLEKPLTELRNPAIISIPIGFALVILGSLFGSGRRRDLRADLRWNEMVVRQIVGHIADGSSPEPKRVPDDQIVMMPQQA